MLGTLLAAPLERRCLRGSEPQRSSATYGRKWQGPDESEVS